MSLALVSAAMMKVDEPGCFAERVLNVSCYSDDCGKC